MINTAYLSSIINVWEKKEKNKVRGALCFYFHTHIHQKLESKKKWICLSEFFSTEDYNCQKNKRLQCLFVYIKKSCLLSLFLSLNKKKKTLSLIIVFLFSRVLEPFILNTLCKTLIYTFLEISCAIVHAWCDIASANSQLYVQSFITLFFFSK